MTENWGYMKAMQDFRRERNRAALQQILSRLTGRPADLMSFEDVAKKLRVKGGSDRGLQDIPIDAIVGSVSRYNDFTRGFFPRHDEDIERWSRVKVAVFDGPIGVSPIEVYKIGDVYFVNDGHHRVSVAKHLGAKQIQAHVHEIQTKVPLTPETSPEDLIIKSEFADFLAHTQVDSLIPDADLRVTVPGSYRRLEEHIQVHQYFMGLESKQEVPYSSAVKHWYTEVYLPVRRAIEERGVLHEFPGRTETDLYLWISDHQYLLEKELGWEIRPENAASSLARSHSPRARRVFQRAARRLIDAVTLDTLEPPVSPGSWRKEKGQSVRGLFQDALVPVNGGEPGWQALEQALLLAQREQTHLNGLHINTTRSPDDQKDIDEIRRRFNQRCLEAGVSGGLAVTEGEIARQICEWAALSDIVILNVSHPPGADVLSRLSSGLRVVIRRCVRPILLIPGQVSSLNRMLLAYDGSPRAREALFISAYLAGKWGAPLTVVTAMEDERAGERLLDAAEKYLKEQKVEAKYLLRPGPAGNAILDVAKEYQSELILLGGYGFTPLVEVVVGSTVDQLLRTSTIPLLVCQ